MQLKKGINMADIISGKSRFNGDRNAPVKKIININTEVAASSENDEDVLDEEVVKKKIRRHKIRGAVVILVIMMIAIAVYAVVLRVIDNYDYKSYAITNSINRDDIESSKYVAFADGYVRYSNDGISYYKSNGKVIWNQTYSMQNPAVSICGNSIAVADINGSSAFSFNADGQVGKADTSMPILQIEVSSGGKIAAVLEDTNANYINMYDTNGDKIYSVKTTLSGDGYPLDISISSDAKKLIASFIKVSGDEIKTNVVFYNFSDVGKNETERVVGGFNYDDVIVGDVKFIDDTQAVAVGENVVSIYKIKEYPSLEHTIDLWTSYVSLILCMISLSSGNASPMHCPASLAFSAFCTSLARPTYAGSFLESANSARPRGLDLYDEVSPDGISSSVVVTGSCISDTTLMIRFSGSATISGQSLILGPNWISCSGSATPLLSNTLFA
jgi:hypothetical protein